jgi:aryl-alcohol dehydrogenase-like predicted oxidoreductase
VLHRHLGSSGLQVSEIAYGNWITHGSQIDETTAVACVDAALDAGITTFDTADVYADTRAETVLGRALKGRYRDGLEIATKVFFPTGPGPNGQGLSRKHIMRSAEESLRRLGTDYIDLYQAHRFDHGTPVEETLRAFDDLIRQGKILYVGVSEWTASQIGAAVSLAEKLGINRLVSNQPQYSMLWRVIEDEVVPMCESHGVSQIVWSPLAQGVLTGKYLPGQPVPDDSRAADQNGAQWVQPFLRQEILYRVQLLRPLADEAGLTLAQLALAWVLNNRNVAAAIVGGTQPDQIRSNAEASGTRLDQELLKQIDEILDPVVERDPAKTESAA